MFPFRTPCDVRARIEELMTMSEPERSPGWTSFASITIGIAGGWNLILGVAAFAKKESFHTASLLYQNLSFWGVVWIVLGAVQVLTAVLVIRRSTAGKALGIIGASVSMLVWFFSLDARPIASVLVITLDALILYALTADRPYAGGPYPPGARAVDVAPPVGRHFG
jgi:hypothetical protein